MKDLEGGAVEVLRVPACLREFVGETCNLREEAWWIGGGVVHLQLGWDFDFLFLVGEGD